MGDEDHGELAPVLALPSLQTGPVLGVTFFLELKSEKTDSDSQVYLTFAKRQFCRPNAAADNH